MSARALRASAAVLPAPSRALHQRSARQRRAVCGVTRASAGGVVARWSVDARFGCKSQALALVRTCTAAWRYRLLQRSQLGEWVTDVASQAGVATEEARILASQLGVPESRLELELRFGSLADMEQFFSALPAADHAAWGARLAPVVCDGSATWHTFRVVDVASKPAKAAAAAQPAPPALPTVLRRSAGGLFLVGEPDAQATRGQAAPPAPDDSAVDWKGDPIVWKPGDRVPRVAE